MPNGPRQFLKHRRSEEPLSTLIAFPRVGKRSISDEEYNTFNDHDEDTPGDEGKSSSNLPSSLELPPHQFGKRTRIHTRASKGSMMAFPRVGRSSPTNAIARILSSHAFNYGKGQFLDEQGILVVVISESFRKATGFMVNVL